MPIDDAKYMLINLAASPNISMGVRIAPNARKITRSIWMQHKVILDVHEIEQARAFRWRISHGRAFTAGPSRATWLISMSRASEFLHFRF